MKILLFTLLVSLPLLGEESPAVATSVAAAENFLSTLDPTQKSKAALAFTNEERENFRYTPRDRAGLLFKEMNDTQREAAMKLLDSALSEEGKLKATQVMSLESILADLDKDPVRRDAGRYFFAVFGTPGDPRGWGWRAEGHHLSVNLTFVAGKGISVTPSFMGA
ncbi:MAG: DUF3500 domain-containing protein, partial [Luteolibacter sp.]